MNIEIVNKFGKFWIDENGIFNFKYHPGAVIHLEDAKFLVKERLKLFNGNRYPFLIDYRGLKYASPEASKYFASEEGGYLITAGAFLVGSFLSRLNVSFHIKLHPRPNPRKVFTSREEAVAWLNSFK